MLKTDLTSVGEKQFVTNFEVTGLKSATNYSFAVAAVSQNITGPLSRVIYSSTLAGIIQLFIIFSIKDYREFYSTKISTLIKKNLPAVIYQ